MSRSTRILHLRSSDFLGGPERQLLRYAEFEKAGPLEVIIGTFVGGSEGRELSDAVRERGLPILDLPAGPVGDIGALPPLIRFVAEREIALICTHGYQADVMGTLAGSIRRVPVACFLRGWTRDVWKVRLYESLDRFLLPLANRIVCLSATQASAVARRTSLRRKIRVVMNSVDRRTVSVEDRSCARRMLRARLNLPMDCMIVATAGRLSPEKGTSCFVESLPMIRSRFPETQFVVFGDGRLREQLVRLADHHGLSSALRFVGRRPDFVELLPGIDILVNPSLSEVMPNVILEAMAAAVPVVATDVGSVREIAGKDKVLVLAPPSDPTALGGAITDMLNDPITAQAAGREGQMRVREAFSPELQCLQLRALYREMIPGVTWGQSSEIAESCSPFFAHSEGSSGFLSGRRNARDPG